MWRKLCLPSLCLLSFMQAGRGGPAISSRCERLRQAPTVKSITIPSKALLPFTPSMFQAVIQPHSLSITNAPDRSNSPDMVHSILFPSNFSLIEAKMWNIDNEKDGLTSLLNDFNIECSAGRSQKAAHDNRIHLTLMCLQESHSHYAQCKAPQQIKTSSYWHSPTEARKIATSLSRNLSALAVEVDAKVQSCVEQEFRECSHFSDNIIRK